MLSIRRTIEKVIRSFVLADEVERALTDEGYVIATPKRLKKERDQGFAAGVAVACSTFVGPHGEHPGITEVLVACNFDTRQKLKRLGVDDYDLNILSPVFAELRRDKTLTSSKANSRGNNRSISVASRSAYWQ